MYGLSVMNRLSSLVFVCCVLGRGEGVNLARSIFGWGSLCDWLFPLCDLSGGLLGCFQGCVSSSVMNKGWLKRMSCITGSVTFISAVRYLSFWTRLVSVVTEWILDTEARLVVLTCYEAWHVVSWKQLLVTGFHLWRVVLGCWVDKMAMERSTCIWPYLFSLKASL